MISSYSRGENNVIVTHGLKKGRTRSPSSPPPWLREEIKFCGFVDTHTSKIS